MDIVHRQYAPANVQLVVNENRIQLPFVAGSITADKTAPGDEPHLVTGVVDCDITET